MLNDAVLASMKKSVLCWLATADANGAPNVSPKEIFCAHGPNVVLMANLASPGSAENIAHNPNVCVSFIDPFVQKGFKLKGQARLLHESDEAFATLALPLTQLAGPRFPFRSLFAIEIDCVEPIIAPSYRLYPETSEARQVESAMKSYGVRPDTD